jgi:hypothetical protein
MTHCTRTGPRSFDTILSHIVVTMDAPGASARVSDFWRSKWEMYHKNMTFLLWKISFGHRYSINIERSEHSFPAIFIMQLQRL